MKTYWLLLLALGLGVLAILSRLGQVEDGEDLAQDEDRRAW